MGNFRTVAKTYTFANGLTVPEGTILGALVSPINMDHKIYPDANQFDGFRFSKLRELGGNANHYSATTSLNYLHFGYGQHGWYMLPQRF